MESKKITIQVSIGQGFELLQKKDYSGAIVLFEKAIDIDPTNAVAWEQKGVAHFELEEFPDAIKAFGKAISLDNNCFDAYFSMGILYAQVPQTERAIECMLEAARIRPEHEGLWYTIGGLLDEIGDSESALTAYKNAVHLDPNDASAWNNIGVLHRKLEQFDTAIAALSRAIDVDPNVSCTWENLAGVYFHKGKYEDAIVACENAIELYPENWSAWNQIGSSYLKLNCIEESVQAHKKSTGINPHIASSWQDLSRAQYLHTDYRGCLESLNNAIELEPNNADHWAGKSAAMDALGRSEEALYCVNKALDLDPSHKPALDDKVVILTNLRRYDEARNLSASLTEAYPDFAQFWFSKGRVEIGAPDENVLSAVNDFRKFLHFASPYEITFRRQVIASYLDRHSIAPLLVATLLKDSNSLQSYSLLRFRFRHSFSVAQQVHKLVIYIEHSSDLSDAAKTYLSGLLFYYFGDAKKSLQYFKKTIRLNNHRYRLKASYYSILAKLIWTDDIGTELRALREEYLGTQAEPNSDPVDSYYRGQLSLLLDEQTKAREFFENCSGFLPAKYMLALLSNKSDKDRLSREILDQEAVMYQQGVAGYLGPINEYSIDATIPESENPIEKFAFRTEISEALFTVYGWLNQLSEETDGLPEEWRFVDRTPEYDTANSWNTWIGLDKNKRMFFRQFEKTKSNDIELLEAKCATQFGRLFLDRLSENTSLQLGETIHSETSLPDRHDDYQSVIRYLFVCEKISADEAIHLLIYLHIATYNSKRSDKSERNLKYLLLVFGDMLTSSFEVFSSSYDSFLRILFDAKTAGILFLVENYVLDLIDTEQELPTYDVFKTSLYRFAETNAKVFEQALENESF